MDTPGTTMLKKSSYHQILLMSSLLKRKIKSNVFAECVLSWFLSAEPGSLRLHICHCGQNVAEKASETIELIVPSSGPRACLQTVTHTHIFLLNFKTTATVRQAGEHIKSVTDKYVKGENRNTLVQIPHLIWPRNKLCSCRIENPRIFLNSWIIYLFQASGTSVSQWGETRCDLGAPGAALQTQADPPGLPEQQTGTSWRSTKKKKKLQLKLGGWKLA